MVDLSSQTMCYKKLREVSEDQLVSQCSGTMTSGPLEALNQRFTFIKTE